MKQWRVFVKSGNVIEVRGLKNNVTGAFDEGATVSLTVIDRDGDQVAGESWPLVMSSVGGGKYRATLSHAVDFDRDGIYTAQIRITGSSGEADYREVELIGTVKGARYG